MKISTRQFTIILVLFCIAVFALAIRGIPGSPDSPELNDPKWKDEGPLELSPERGRFALLYSTVEDNSFQFSLDVARFTTPDVAYSNGQYVSLFAPGLSFLLVPGYVIGRFLGASVLGTYSVIALFALLNILLIAAISIRLGASKISASIGALIFAFATPAFAYGVALYQHHISTFLLLSAVYALMRWTSVWTLALVGFLASFSLVVDYPNLFMMLPIGIFALNKFFFQEKVWSLSFSKLMLPGIFTVIAVAIPMVLMLWFNYASHGDAFQLTGTLAAVKEIDEQGFPTQSNVSELLDLENPEDIQQKQKTALGLFKTRNLLNGFYTHLISPDRGIINFSPVILLGIVGLILLYRKNASLGNLFIGIVSVNLLLYSMWSDPYGGWAFGSRYLIPGYAILAVGLALALDRWKKNYLYLAIFTVLMIFSVWVNSLGAITSSTNPPRVEILGLEQITGQEEKYSFDRNLEFLQSRGSKSAMYQTFGKNYVTPGLYLNLLTALIVLFVVSLFIYQRFDERQRK